MAGSIEEFKCNGGGWLRLRKTRFYAKPNVMQANTSFVVLDQRVKFCGHRQPSKANGYEIKVLDLINMHLSHCYNPFAYLKDDKDVLKLVTNLIQTLLPKAPIPTIPFGSVRNCIIGSIDSLFAL